MSTEAGVGISHHRNPKVAAQEAAAAALKQAKITKPDFVLMFSTAGYDQPTIVKAVREATGNAPLAGCSGEGVIARGVADESAFALTVMVIRSDEMKLKHALATGLAEGSSTVGAKLGTSLRESGLKDTKAMLLFTDGLMTSFDPFRDACEKAMQSPVPIPMYGGYSGDNALKQTFQYFDDQVVSGGAVGVLLQGNFNLTVGIDAGCTPPVGAPHRITKAVGNQIHEIDGKRATDWLKDFTNAQGIGGGSWDAMNVLVYVLAFRAEGHTKKLSDFVMRGIPAKDDANGTLMLYNDVKEGTEFWATTRDPERMQQGVEKLGERIAQQLGPNKPKLVFQFDCGGRGKMMLPEEKRNEMVNALQKKVGGDAPWIGLYTFGEIGAVEGANSFHNYTVVLAAIH